MSSFEMYTIYCIVVIIFWTGFGIKALIEGEITLFMIALPTVVFCCYFFNKTLGAQDEDNREDKQ